MQLDKVYIVERLAISSMGEILAVFNTKEKAQDYIEKLDPAAKRNKNGDWVTMDHTVYSVLEEKVN